MKIVTRSPWMLLVVACVCVTTGVGCESLQKKLTRKSKTPAARPTPIVTFQDYSRAMTPLDRYRKHYAIFDYWNAELLDALNTPATSALNPKRAKRASAESLQELQTLYALLQDDVAAHSSRLLEERARMDRTIQQDGQLSSQLDTLRRTLEEQSRTIHRELFWRKVQDRLKTTSPADANLR